LKLPSVAEDRMTGFLSTLFQIKRNPRLDFSHAAPSTCPTTVHPHTLQTAKTLKSNKAG
jgi:hypothetical protein